MGNNGDALIKVIVPHCGNKAGFVCGTCIRCGFNNISNYFTWIQVAVEDLPTELNYLIIRHAASTKRYEEEGEK